MKYLSLVRDGSKGKLVSGYWCIEVYAYGKGKKVIPLALDAFSLDDPSVGSQNLQIERTLDAINTVLASNYRGNCSNLPVVSTKNLGLFIIACWMA